jgi:hypothetical protein
LWRPSFCLAHCLISSSLGRGVDGANRKKPPTTSPYRSSGRPTTLASVMLECSRSRSSISRGKMFSPPNQRPCISIYLNRGEQEKSADARLTSDNYVFDASRDVPITLVVNDNLVPGVHPDDPIRVSLHNFIRFGLVLPVACLKHEAARAVLAALTSR